MTSRQLPQSIVFVVTMITLVIGFVLLMRGMAKPFLVVTGVYFAFLLLFTVCCWMLIPRRQRMLPAMPPEFAKLRIGKIDASVQRLLVCSSPLETVELNDGTHRLFRVDYPHELGIWSCEIEERHGDILAFSVSFQSLVSPVLSRSRFEGVGAFFPGD